MLFLRFKCKKVGKSWDKPVLDITLKSIAVFFFLLCILRMVFYDSFVQVVNNDLTNIFGVNIAHSLLRWGVNIAIVVYPMAAFFKSRLFKNISVFVCLPFAIAAVFNFDQFIWYYSQAGGKGWVVSMNFREALLAIELIISIVFPLLLLLCDRHVIKVTDKKEVLVFLAALPYVIYRMCPISVPQSIFGYTDITYASFTAGNILWIVLILAEISILTQIFRFKSYRERYMICMFLALVCFVKFNSLFMMGFDLKRLPVQLCNLAPYFFLIALLTKSKRFFNFVFLVCITGAMVAIAVPMPEQAQIGSFWAFHYFVEHTLVLIVPLLCNLLRIFPRLENAKAIKHMTVGFAIYFFSCLTIGTVLNGITDITNQAKVNYFFMFDIESINKILALPSIITSRIVLFDRFVLYPIFQLLMFGLFWLLCVIVYFGIQKLYAYIDDHFELRLARINLQEKVTNTKSNAVREFTD